MHAPIKFIWTLLLVVVIAWLRSGEMAVQATPCAACEAWEALEDTYNSTGNLTDIGYNRTAGGADGQGGMNQTTSRNATIPMPNGTALPSPTKSPRSLADLPFTAKTALVITILLLVA